MDPPEIAHHSDAHTYNTRGALIRHSHTVTRNTRSISSYQNYTELCCFLATQRCSRIKISSDGGGGSKHNVKSDMI